MDGILIIDKPVGMTSHDVVYQVRKATGESRIGHTGTLDPLASGVLILCLGRAAKLVKFLTEHDKEYEAEIELGYETDTLDREGTVTKTLACEEMAESAVDQALATFLGPSFQIPPVYSAVRVEGHKLYEYARKNQTIPEIEPRSVMIQDLRRTSGIQIGEGVARFTFYVACGKGTFIRSLCRDLGGKLGYPATMTNLRRTRVGTFSLADSVMLEEALRGEFTLRDPLSGLGMPILTVDDETAFKVKNGVALVKEWFSSTDPTILEDEKRTALAIYEYDSTTHKMRLSVLL